MRRRCDGVGWNTSAEPARLTNAVRMSDCLIMTDHSTFRRCVSLKPFGGERSQRAGEPYHASSTGMRAMPESSPLQPLSERLSAIPERRPLRQLGGRASSPPGYRVVPSGIPVLRGWQSSPATGL